ncbi:MAG: HIT domain-containing protein [Caulobacteraceae bacterium]|nr:HIT domain-containing protein [Caulobacteraceae bacterium]
MSLDGEYDRANIFARILRGEAPAARIFEDTESLAFMDVFPQARGHSLAIHKTVEARNLLDVEAAPLQALILTVRRIVRATREALNPDGILVSQFNGAAAGQTIYHLHFHIVPRWQGQPPRPHGAGAMADPDELADLAKQIAARMEG